MFWDIRCKACYLNVYDINKFSWTLQTVETMLLHQLTNNLISYLWREADKTFVK